MIVQVGTVGAILALGVFMYAMQYGGLRSSISHMRQLAAILTSANVETDLIPMPYDVPVCTAPQQNMMIILSVQDSATVYIQGVNGFAMPAPLNVPFYLPMGSYNLIGQPKLGYAWSARSVFNFTVSKACDNATNTLSSTGTGAIAPLASSTTVIASTTSTLTGGSTSTTNTSDTTSSTQTTTTITTNTTTNTVPNYNYTQTTAVAPTIDTTFSVTKNYTTDWNITPTVMKDNVRIYTGVGQVTFSVEVPSDKALMLFGTDAGWTATSVYGSDKGLYRVSGTPRWNLPFDTTKFTDGNYRIAAAYFDQVSGWKVTGFVDLRIANAPIAPVLVAPTSSIATSAEQYNPSWKPTSTSPVTPTEAPFVPTLRLVVDDHQVTALSRVFDRELLEMRATTLPAQSVQFLALSLDGAFKPAIKELGKGGRDELLSRDGKEVWTYTVDMGGFPSGSYRLFARVRTLANVVLETAPVSISVQHLNQLTTSANPPVESGELPPATATREQILLRVQDPSTCQNRQECQVYCSSSGIASQKCVDFARVQSAAGYNETLIASDVTKLQETIRDQFSGKLTEFISRAAYTGTTSVRATGTSSIQVAGVTSTPLWVYPNVTERPSLADVLPLPVLEATVANPLKLAAELPAEVHTPADFQSYCGTLEHVERCTKIITNIAPDLSSALKQQEDIVQRVEQHASQVIEQRTGARVFTDTDGDGISDYDEINIFHTDPNKRDTFNTGYSDGATLLSQASGQGQVAGTTTSAGIVLAGGLAVENPKITGTTQSNIMNVASVAALELKDTPDGKKDVAKALFKGKALPNSFVKLYLFSDPIVVTVKTDDQGNWSYILDKTLPDGAHSAYVAMVDNGGRILAKSSPLPFVKEASALTVEAAGPDVGIPETTGMFNGLSPLALIALVVGILGLGLSVIGAVIGIRHSKKMGGDAGSEIN